MIEPLPHADGAILPVRAQPGAKRSKVIGEHGGALRVSVTAPADQGKANAALASTIADALGCKPAQVELLSGQTHREKRFLVRGVSPTELSSRLARILEAIERAAAAKP